jgi:hypothetical protein
VRLDHLLSKELQAPRVTGCVAGCPLLIVEHWLFSRISCPGLVSTLLLCGCGTGAAGRGAGWARCWVLREQARGVWGLGQGRFPGDADVFPGSGFRLFLENCTVDASISCFLQDVT